MKKILALFLAIMMTLSLAACFEETPANTKESNPLDDLSAALGDLSNKLEDAVGNKEKEKITFTEQVAVDNDQCSIKITGIDSTALFGLTLKAQIENKSADKTYMFSVQNTVINGVQCDSLFAEEVAPGKKANTTILFADDELEENGVGNYTDIELTFRVYDSNVSEAIQAVQEVVPCPEAG